MNIRHLEFFKELAQTQHMSKAAEILGISQPTLSYAIDKLEEELGLPLFEKDGRNIKLTYLGKVYLQFITRGLKEFDQGEEFVKQSLDFNTGHVKLGFTYTMGQRLVPELITAFNSEFIKQNISFDFSQGNTADLLKKLIDAEFDLVISSYLPRIFNQSTSKILSFTPLVKQEIVLAVAPEHPLANRGSVSIHDLAKYPIIYFSQNSGLRPLIDNIFSQAHIKPNIICEVEEDHTMVGFVQYGYGIALIPNLPQLNTQLVNLIHLKDTRAHHQIYLVQRSSHFITPSVVRFKTFIEDYCQKNFTETNQLL